MTREEASIIKDFSLCDFTEIHQFYKEKSEARKQMSKEEKAKLKAENEQIMEEYGWCIIDKHKEKIGNFKTEPPGLFRGRGDHPKQGKIKVSMILHVLAYCPNHVRNFMYTVFFKYIVHVVYYVHVHVHCPNST